jgi:hypothetical protein
MLIFYSCNTRVYVTQVKRPFLWIQYAHAFYAFVLSETCKRGIYSPSLLIFLVTQHKVSDYLSRVWMSNDSLVLCICYADKFCMVAMQTSSVWLLCRAVLNQASNEWGRTASIICSSIFKVIKFNFNKPSQHALSAVLPCRTSQLALTYSDGRLGMLRCLRLKNSFRNISWGSRKQT